MLKTIEAIEVKNGYLSDWMGSLKQKQFYNESKNSTCWILSSKQMELNASRCFSEIKIPIIENMDENRH